MSKKYSVFCLFFVALLLAAALQSPARGAATQINIPAPAGTYNFGRIVKALPNGNIIVTDPAYNITSPTNASFAGAVFLYNGRTGALISQMSGERSSQRMGEIGSVTILANGNFVVSSAVWSAEYNSLMGAVRLCSGTTGCSGPMTAANSLIGNKPDDYVGSVVTPLANGNYLVGSGNWDNGSIVDAGALTFCSGVTGCTGLISATNSLVGSNDNDQVGGFYDPPRTIVTLPNGDYFVGNSRWNGYRGAITFGDGNAGTVGTVSASNSFVGSNPNDQVGRLYVLGNGNYVVGTPSWNGGRGAVTLRTAATGFAGTLSAANSLTGTNPGDRVGTTVTPLANGNYVVNSPEWDLNSFAAVGAVTFCSGTTGCFGTVSPANSLIGSIQNDQIGQFGVTALATGNYIVRSPNWAGGLGAVTFGSGTNGIIGTVSAQNSLVGTQRFGMEQDHVGERQLAILNNGNVAIGSERWFNTRGAVTLMNGNTGLTGQVSAANSLVGSTVGDYTGAKVLALATGNYVVGSSGWDNGANVNNGAATFCIGISGCTGTISAANSLIGNPGDRVSGHYQGLKALANGNYVVISSDWNGNRGAVTWGNGTTGTTGLVSAENSLVGQTAEDLVGDEGVVVLPDGNYVVNSPSWHFGAVASAGAVTFGNGSSGTRGAVSATNSLVGNKTSDAVGLSGDNPSLGGGVFPFADGNYIIISRYWDNGNRLDTGAVSLGKSNVPVTGIVSAENSVLGMYERVGFGRLVADYSVVNRQMIVGRPDSNTVTILRFDTNKTVFDFDGDGKTDVGIFRASDGSWWYSRSSDNAFRVHNFGGSGDLITPGDFTGDGKADIAVFRPSTGEWFVQRSEDNSFFSFPFGASGDIPTPSDFDGDGKTDAAIFRPASGTWFILNSNGSGTSIVQFGASEDKPVPADYDGDGKSDIAIFRPSDGSWWYLRSIDAQFRVFRFGLGTDKPVPGDYSGDGRADLAVFRESTGEWFFQRSEDNSYYSVPFGAPGDVAAPGDYDGDGRFDTAVFRPATANWFVQRSTAGILITSFGANGDRPIPNAFIQ